MLHFNFSCFLAAGPIVVSGAVKVYWHTHTAHAAPRETREKKGLNAPAAII